ncbi:hypothetical protein SISSUDRAFT_1125230 [Sistotremastrum suecicum HHB10207 ss-3]|uniref:Mitochondrial distribution and morphology protein 34 n=1 Tax=Sistotremastrum suecicum HHB10207 ss-3 TaxID=1314776 RepID=A0A166HQY5_9AGAM|nr:hypothetical protein SISSUDRAFT_1125230 [Sistotremastrum suecicum HHB10207 ss-3]
MSFTFNWPKFSEQFHADAKVLLDAALNKGNTPPIIADRIEVVELEMGTQPPELEIRDIGELTVDQFRGIFRLTYSGNAHIVLRTKVQANPLNHKRNDIHLMSGSMGILAAHQPLVVPMKLRLSNFKLSAYVVLVVSRQKGITLVFKTDPLQNVDVNSTFDSIAVIQKYIQREIEGQLRDLFREDLPGIIHKLSQRWLAAQSSKKIRVDTSYPALKHKAPPRENIETQSLPDTTTYSIPSVSNVRSAPLSMRPSLERGMHSGRASFASHESQTSGHAPQSEPLTFPELENFDPTYGLRPDDLPSKSGYSGLARLFDRPKGLAELAEDEALDIRQDDQRSGSFALVDWDDALSDIPSSRHSVSEEYETFPAVGGGVITRPRVFHSQSRVHSPTDGAQSPRLPIYGRRSSSLLDAAAFGTSGRSTSLHSLAPVHNGGLYGVPPMRTASEDGWPVRPHHRSTLSYASDLPSEIESQDEDQSLSATKAPGRSSSHPGGNRAASPPLSIADTALQTYEMSADPDSESEPKIVLRPNINSTVSYLSTLSHTYHTLSPYTRSLKHFTVRSIPPREQIATSSFPPAPKQPPRARRRRVHHLGAFNSKSPSSASINPPSTTDTMPNPSAEYDPSEVDHYFRTPSHFYAKA